MTIAVIDDYEQDQLCIADHAKQFLKERNNPPPQFYFFSNGEDFIRCLTPHLFDFVLLDCCMDGMDGLETAKMMRNIDEEVPLIFITSCRDYAVDGYLVSAIGYLVKPFSYDSFSNVISNAFQRLPRKKETIAIPCGNETKRILVDDIVFCDIDGHYILIHLSSRQIIKVRMTFSALTSLLSPYPHFLQCYRGCLINMARTQRAEELNFLMDTGERVPFRKKEHSKLIQTYSNYLFEKVRSERI